jgi:hypothetical protein
VTQITEKKNGKKKATPMMAPLFKIARVQGSF